MEPGGRGAHVGAARGVIDLHGVVQAAVVEDLVADVMHHQLLLK